MRVLDNCLVSKGQFQPTDRQRRARRILLWLVTAATGILALLAGIALSWLFLYKSDLPDVRALESVATATHSTVLDLPVCGQRRQVTILPANDLADLRNILIAAEGSVDPRPMLRRLYEDFDSSRMTRLHYGSYSYQIARDLLCNDHRRILPHGFGEIRTAIQLEHQFSAEQLLNIHLNTAVFDGNVYGVEDGARHYFGKHALQLSSAEAALLIAIHAGPGFYSPLRHPDRAVERRNQVLDAMAEQGVISQEAARMAKATPIKITLTTP
jgi:penicillin-binding protein 1A